MDKYSIISWGKFVGNLTVDNFENHLMSDIIGKPQYILPEFFCYVFVIVQSNLSEEEFYG